MNRIPVCWMLLGLLGLNVMPSFQQIPFEMYERLGNITNAAELIQTMLMKNPDDGHVDPLFVGPGAIDPIVADIVAGSVVSPDTCSPKVTSVEIPKDEDPNVCFFPNCVAMQQCGGCGCGHSMLECAPMVERVSLVQVMKMRYPYPGASKFTFEGLIKIPVEEHMQCACRCKVQPHHCHPTKHLYEEHSCRCKCVNDIEAISCPSHKMWSNDECGCVCPKIHWCLEDEFFSNASCRCEMRSSFVKIIDQEQIPLKPDGGYSSGPCVGVVCRPGYRPVDALDGRTCSCKISHVSGVQSGSIGGNLGPMVPEEPAHVPLQVDVPSEDWERVPGHPQFHHIPTTPEPEPTRPVRQRKPRPGPDSPLRQTGPMVPGG